MKRERVAVGINQSWKTDFRKRLKTKQKQNADMLMYWTRRMGERELKEAMTLIKIDAFIH